ncbi:hypothetical protein NM688_g3151 [Phlebia brevispora]|uniref:Uncharacterized protein n=1 Tax=Phlebia brevispora TaxID=194682 RepID=A0ACC1T6G2_9APHY|nr:hypothetical protein NM688_g3151 [Phlebia brevispora]
MFAHGATPGKVDMWCYHEDEEDFTKDATALDVWVLDRLRSLLHNATIDNELDALLRRDKTVFFLHLLGLDTTGHSYRPHSKEYMTNIQVVDSIVRQTEALLAEFYNDGATSFVFTADHGMSRIGNHGGRRFFVLPSSRFETIMVDPDNTRTPLIAWGRQQPWELTHLLRRDVEQADVAALMSSLLGIDWPANSVGVLPDVDHTRPGYLDATKEEQARAALVNAQVILEHYRVKHELKQEHSLFYKPFSYFAEAEDIEDIPGHSKLSHITGLIDVKQYDHARDAAADLIQNALAGIRYLETYDRLLIRAIVVIAYLGWIAYSAVHIVPQEYIRPLDTPKLSMLNLVAFFTLAAVWCSFVFQHSAGTLYLYVIFPIYFWHQAIARAGGSMAAMADKWGKAVYLSDGLPMLLRGIGAVAALQSMVAGYTHRSIWSVGFVFIGVLWPFFFWHSDMFARHRTLCASWVFLCSCTAIFPLLPVHKEENVREIIAGGFGMIVAGVAGIFSSHASMSPSKTKIRSLILSQCALILVSMVITASSASNLRAKLGLPLVNQIAGWVVLVIASVIPFTYHIPHTPAVLKVLTLFLGFSVCFVILSISVEGLFFLSYSATLVTWVEVETILRSHNKPQKTDQGGYQLQAGDIRIALFFLFFVQVAFFGTGNVASISSFYLEPVYRLVPIFNPFLMAALLIFKIIAPYAILAVCFALMNVRLHLPPFSLFLVALTLTDVMTVTFFFKVTDTGSWLEIGQTISFFCISSMLLVWSAGICAVGEVLMADVLKSPGAGSSKEA